MPGLIRVAVIVILAVIAYRLVKRWLANMPRETKPPRNNIEQMVRCQYCGLHIPQEEAIHDQDDWYCSKEHRQLDHDSR